MTPEPYQDENGKWWYSKRTWRCSQQTTARAMANRRDLEITRLRALGADDEEIARMVDKAS